MLVLLLSLLLLLFLLSLLLLLFWLHVSKLFVVSNVCLWSGWLVSSIDLEADLKIVFENGIWATFEVVVNLLAMALGV